MNQLMMMNYHQIELSLDEAKRFRDEVMGMDIYEDAQIVKLGKMGYDVCAKERH